MTASAKSNVKVSYNLYFDTPNPIGEIKHALVTCNYQDKVIQNNLHTHLYNALYVSKDASEKQCGYKKTPIKLLETVVY